ncbi:MAG TPA: halogenase, partial [Candidatus Saccharimonadia bacterium]|nr:halogenase [Candidatus Saccharimonadia bacterium]
RFLDGAGVRSSALGDGAAPHDVEFERDGKRHRARARWLVDASGRAGLLKRQLGLARDNAHDANAVWFRIAAKIDVDEWSDDPAFHARCEVPNRWLSTSHLCGAGYWAWLIPLSSGSHSVGIVCDAKTHPLETMNTFERAMAWFAEHQPRLHRELEGKRHLLQDFRFLRNFSYGCSQVFSPQRWALTGESGVFLDPFYSPGSDFIGIANTYICELVAKDRAGEAFEPYARFYEQLYFSFYESTLTLYTDQYEMFGDPEVMPVKVLWDYTYYWGVLCQLWFQHRLTDLVALGRLREPLQSTKALNAAMQDFMREWSKLSAKRNRAVMLDQARLGWFAELNRGLKDTLDDSQFRERMRETVAQLNALALEIVEHACREHPALDAAAVRALLGDTRAPESSLLFADAA